MTTLTTRLKLPRPELDEPADGPDGFIDLTDVLDPLAAVYLAGTAAARPAPGISGRFYWATDFKTLSYDDGTAWNAVSGPVPSNIPVVTALPTTGLVDGQEVYFQNSNMALDGVMWHLRYRSASATYKWECIGGSPWHTPAVNDSTATGTGSTWSQTIGDGFQAVGRDLPLAGDYFVTWSAVYSLAAAATVQSGVGVWRPNDTTTPYVYVTATNYGSGQVANVSGSGRLIGCTVGRCALSYLYVAQVPTFHQRRLSVLPIKVQ